MDNQDYTATFTVDHSPAEVFEAINNVRGWWGEDIEGRSTEVGDVFTFDVRGVHHSVQQVIDVVPGKRVAWRVLEADLAFVVDRAEWKDTDIHFEIAETPDGALVHFRHVGLVPAAECFGVCSDAWSGLINGSLRSLIETGQGQPFEKNVAARLQPASA